MGRRIWLLVAVVVWSGCTTLERSNLSVDGGQAVVGAEQPAISADGQLVAFVTAEPLEPGDTNGVGDVYVRDHQSDKTERVSFATDGSQYEVAPSAPAISPDGGFVAYETTLAALFPGMADDRPWVALYDRSVGVTSVVEGPENLLVEVKAPQFLAEGFVTTVQANREFPLPYRQLPFGQQCVLAGQFSPSSRGVPDGSGCVDLLPSSTTLGGPGLLVWGTFPSTFATLDTELTIDGMPPDQAPSGFAVSGTGRFVAFASPATNHISGDGDGGEDVFVVDRDPDGNGTLDEQQALPVERVSVAVGGGPPNGASRGPVISIDGRFVVFESSATNLVADDTNTAVDIFRYDRTTGVTERISSPNGGQSNGDSTRPVISDDAAVAAFLSLASNLVPDDTNGAVDVFRSSP